MDSGICPDPSPAPSPQSDLGEASAESGEHFLHVAPLLHGDDPQVVLLVDPHQESLVIIVPRGGVQSSQSAPPPQYGLRSHPKTP